MKIVIPVLELGNSGGYRVLSKLASEFSRKGHEVSFLAPQNACAPYHPTTASIDVYFDPFPNIRILKTITRLLFLTLALMKVASQFNVILGNYHLTAYPVWLASRRSKNGYYYIQAYEPEFFAGELIGSIRAAIAKLSYKLDLFKIVNAPLYLDFREIKSKHIVEPGIDTALFNPRTGNYGLATKSITIGCIGRREKWKGTQEIVTATRAASERIRIEFNKEVLLKIAYQLPGNLDSESLPNSILLVNPHGDSALSEFYKSVDIVVAIGLIQSGAFHYPCLEGLACGKKVVTNYSPGTPNNSYFLNELSQRSIEAAIYSAIKDKIVGEEYHEPFNGEEYAWERVSEKMIGVFQKLQQNQVKDYE